MNPSLTTVLRRFAPLAAAGAVVVGFLACSGTVAQAPGPASCAAGATQCNGTCTLLASDGANCGHCGVTCQADEVCLQGRCSACGGTASACEADGGRRCVSLETDQLNCGRCGRVCGPTTVCRTGKCAPTCDADQTLCTSPNTYCANLQTDQANCGACGSQCGAFETCADGACTSQCDYQQKKCAQDGGAPRCVNTQSDNMNCGDCGQLCPANLPVCVGGKCTAGIYPATCVKANGLIWCYDPKACGKGCGAVCAALGMTLLSDTNIWFNAQNTLAKCSAISQAFGLGPALGIGNATYGCVEDFEGDHSSIGLKAPLICSTWAPCPADHVTMVDGLGLPCSDTHGRRAICPCQ